MKRKREAEARADGRASGKRMRRNKDRGGHGRARSHGLAAKRRESDERKAMQMKDGGRWRGRGRETGWIKQGLCQLEETKEI